MYSTTEGLVLREVKFRESDRMLTILTPQGVISASAKGSLRLKSKLFSACGLFCYSDFALYEGRNGVYQVNEAQVKKLFFDIRNSVEGLAVAMYLAEVVITLHPTAAEAQEMLRLFLNTLHLISQGNKNLHQICTVAELRTISLAGYMPNIVMCDGCGKYEGGNFYLDLQKGQLLCQDCALKQGKQPNLDAASLAAMRHILLSESKKIFSFSLAPQSMNRLYHLVRAQVLMVLEKPPKTLEFLNTVLGECAEPTAQQEENDYASK